MAIVVPDVGELLLLQYILQIVTPAGDKVLHLYANDCTPSEDTDIGSGINPVTEATQAGYASYSMTTWTTSQLAGTTTGLYSQVTFTFTTGADIYGYYVTDTSDNLLWCERFAGAPFSLPTGGGTIAVTPRVELS